uniref:Uncharacterized protein n=1 Tax=viral metagenome TaxID=1070528 RepID=A0A6C0H7U7_9ZZZZ
MCSIIFLHKIIIFLNHIIISNTNKHIQLL